MSDLQLQEHEPLARHTSWRTGGPARFFLSIADDGQLRRGIALAQQRELPLALLGGGTNTLALDGGFGGLVLRLRDSRTSVEDLGSEGRLWAAAGAPMAGTARRVTSAGWQGLEWAEGVPGTVGGAVFGNAGCYGGDVASCLSRAWLLHGGTVEEWPVERLGFGYRTSALKQGAGGNQPIVLAAEFRLQRGEALELRQRLTTIATERKSKTPWGSSCGSVFKNPPGHSAGQLIEQVGLKGRSSGPAIISERHANYIVNSGGATSSDILRLIDLARSEVSRRLGIELALEVQLLGQP